jgi:hypothetical protein
MKRHSEAEGMHSNYPEGELRDLAKEPGYELATGDEPLCGWENAPYSQANMERMRGTFALQRENITEEYWIPFEEPYMQRRREQSWGRRLPGPRKSKKERDRPATHRDLDELRNTLREERRSEHEERINAGFFDDAAGYHQE